MDLIEHRLPSGRVVRIRLLKPSEADACAAAADAKVGTETTMFEYARMKRAEGVKAFIVSATKSPVPLNGDGDYPMLEDSKFVPCDGSKFDDEWTAKDASALSDIYRHHHEVGPGEVGTIMGKARQLTTA